MYLCSSDRNYGGLAVGLLSAPQSECSSAGSLLAPFLWTILYVQPFLIVNRTNFGGKCNNFASLSIQHHMIIHIRPIGMWTFTRRKGKGRFHRTIFLWQILRTAESTWVSYWILWRDRTRHLYCWFQSTHTRNHFTTPRSIAFPGTSNQCTNRLHVLVRQINKFLLWHELCTEGRSILCEWTEKRLTMSRYFVPRKRYAYVSPEGIRGREMPVRAVILWCVEMIMCYVDGVCVSGCSGLLVVNFCIESYVVQNICSFVSCHSYHTFNAAYIRVHIYPKSTL